MGLPCVALVSWFVINLGPGRCAQAGHAPGAVRRLAGHWWELDLWIHAWPEGAGVLHISLQYDDPGPVWKDG
jgi:hypothetical protein